MRTARIHNLLIKGQPSRGRTKATQLPATTHPPNLRGQIPTRRHSLRAPTAIRRLHAAAAHQPDRATATHLPKVHPQVRVAAILHRGVHPQDPAEAIRRPGVQHQVQGEALQVEAVVLHQVQAAAAADKLI